MANFASDLSSAYVVTGTLFATSTGVTTSAHLQGASVDTTPIVSNNVSAILVVGNVAGTSPTMDAKMQESTDGTTWTDVASGAFTQVTQSTNVQTLPIQPTKRYLRSTGTVGGTTPVLETTILVVGPRQAAPSAVGGFNLTAVAGNG